MLFDFHFHKNDELHYLFPFILHIQWQIRCQCSVLMNVVTSWTILWDQFEMPNKTRIQPWRINGLWVDAEAEKAEGFITIIKHPQMAVVGLVRSGVELAQRCTRTVPLKNDSFVTTWTIHVSNSLLSFKLWTRTHSGTLGYVKDACFLVGNDQMSCLGKQISKGAGTKFLEDVLLVLQVWWNLLWMSRIADGDNKLSCENVHQ